MLACNPNWRAEFHPPPGEGEIEPPTASEEAVFVKVHTLDGEVYVLESWSFDESKRTVHGQGLHYSAERDVLGSGGQTISYDQVALLETNTPERLHHATSLAIIGVVAGAVAGVGIFCAINPKACFGSCPTFYVREPGEGLLSLRAEGFSSSVAESLEARDVDHLGVVDPPSGRFELTVANEAFETHFLRHVELLSVARPDPSVEVFHTREGFAGARDLVAPIACRAGDAGERDCLAEVGAQDELEYASLTDSRDLATREVVELEFRADRHAERALIVRARNSLLDTFLFYQGLAYMGRELPRWIWRADEEGPDGALAQLLRGFDRELGDIEVEVWDGRRWRAAGQFSEYGPIAEETQLIPLPTVLTPAGEPLRVRLILTQGRWKLDRLALAELTGPLEAQTLVPVSVTHDGRDDPEALARLLDDQTRLHSYPGDVWGLGFEIPEGPQTLFLAAEGFYWEWMREDWMVEEDGLAAVRFFADPGATLRRLAPAFKALETNMEPVFWETRLRPLPLEGAVDNTLGPARPEPEPEPDPDSDQNQDRDGGRP